MSILFSALACTGPAEKPDEVVDEISAQDVIGWVHKGPFAAGGTVSVREFTAAGDGPVLATVDITDDLGAFQANLATEAPLTLSATGTWYNEITNTVDTAVELHATTDLALGVSGSEININVATTLVSSRVAVLAAADLRSGGRSITGLDS